MLKKLPYLTVILYIAVLYGQNLFEFGSDTRINFYFIGMAIVQFMISYLFFKLMKNVATSYYFFMRGGDLFNQVFYGGDITHIEIYFGVLGIIYILTENKIKKWTFRS